MAYPYETTMLSKSVISDSSCISSFIPVADERNRSHPSIYAAGDLYYVAFSQRFVRSFQFPNSGFRLDITITAPSRYTYEQKMTMEVVSDASRRRFFRRATHVVSIVWLSLLWMSWAQEEETDVHQEVRNKKNAPERCARWRCSNQFFCGVSHFRLIVHSRKR